MSETITKLIYKSLDDIAKISPEALLVERNEEGLIYGRDGPLDSLGLINFIVALEKNIRDEFHRTIDLTLEDFISVEASPFRSIRSTRVHVSSLIK